MLHLSALHGTDALRHTHTQAKKDEAKINKAKIQSGLEDPNDMVEVASESEESELSDSPAPKKKSTAKATKKAPAKKSTASAKKTASSTTKKVSGSKGGEGR